ncbi:MAG: DUF3800 domain-containing protein [Thaumarchaeota archaeon S15]|nr:MAG: DUF3800 domain-containing protein [Thaumarchaeota archaeon S15]RNJ74266.1 MAG: DUF3800 domain-containing protein [Thaumarchaeota archaeon S14]
MAEWEAYVDESGSRLSARQGKSRFVLACVAGSPRALGELEGKIQRLKLELVPGADPAKWELHASKMFHNIGDSPLGSMSTEQNMRVMRKIMDIVCGCDVMLFNIVIMGTRMHGKRATDTRIVEHATALLVEKLEQLAAGQGAGTTLRVISDNVLEKTRLAMKRALARRAARRSAPLEGARRVTGIMFVDSRSSALVQVADAIAYIINRHEGGDAAFGCLFRLVERKVWRSRGRRE